MVWKRVWTMPVGMNKCVFRTERRTFERSIITKRTFLLTRKGKIKKGLQGWNYRQGELQERLRGTQYEACPQMTSETSLGAQESSQRKRWLPCPQTKTVPNTRNQGNWRQEARILRSGYPSSTLRAVVSPRRTKRPAWRNHCSQGILLPFCFEKRKENAWSQVTRHATKIIKKLYPRNLTLSNRARGQRKTFLGLHLFGNSLPRPQEPFVVKIIPKRG